MDVIKILLLLLQWEIPTQSETCAGDIDYDGTLTILDLLLIADLASGG